MATLVRSISQSGGVLCAAIDSTDIAAKAEQIHETSATVTAALGRLLTAASLMGVRETRHFKGLYTLNEWDILKKAVFEDWIVRGAEFNFDVHNMTGASLDATGAQAKFPHVASLAWA